MTMFYAGTPITCIWCDKSRYMTSQSGGDVLIIGVYAHRTRYDDVLCGYTNHMYLV
ncbi:hypothetical protein [Escherichia coli]|uniref:hypothetical protein n=1 Tax=Escherichia coli TaxID=562 RepID=UPI0015CABE55|nr:hypothetical protein [Escherichia coli]